MEWAPFVMGALAAILLGGIAFRRWWARYRGRVAEIPDPLKMLVDISKTERTDAESRFVAAEAGVAGYALVHARASLADGDVLGGWMYIRLLTETGIRLRWIAGPSAAEPDAQGAPRIDRSDTLARIASLAKRDYGLTLGSYKAVRKIRIELGEIDENDQSGDLSGQIAAMADRIAGEAAPADVKTLAELSREGRQLYAEFRNSSSIIHPGSALGRVPIGDRDRATSQAELAGFLCAAWAAPVYRALG
jgi:hypothetical protein